MPRVHALYRRDLDLALNAGVEGSQQLPSPQTGDNQARLQMMTNVLREEEATSSSFENHCSMGTCAKATTNIHKDQR